MTQLTHPLPGGTPTSPFGWRDGFYSGGVWVPPMFHNGADFAAPTGTPIKAMHDGRIDFNGWDGQGGWTVGITGKAGRSLYSHMNQQSTDVHVGQKVVAGQTIGRVGSSGLATGPHLHAMFDHGKGWVDPVPFINKNNDAPAGQKEDEEMARYIGSYIGGDTNTPAKDRSCVIYEPTSGFYTTWSGVDQAYTNEMARTYGTASFNFVTKKHWEQTILPQLLIQQKK